MTRFSHIEISHTQAEYNRLTNNHDTRPYKIKEINGVTAILCFYCDKRAAPSWEHEAYICIICKKELCKSCAKKHDGVACFAKFLIAQNT